MTRVVIAQNNHAMRIPIETNKHDLRCMLIVDGHVSRRRTEVEHELDWDKTKWLYERNRQEYWSQLRWLIR
jgi:hypothetical protein